MASWNSPAKWPFCQKYGLFSCPKSGTVQCKVKYFLLQSKIETSFFFIQMLHQIFTKILIWNRCLECPILLFPQNLHSAKNEGMILCANRWCSPLLNFVYSRSENCSMMLYGIEPSSSSIARMYPILRAKRNLIRIYSKRMIWLRFMKLFNFWSGNLLKATRAKSRDCFLDLKTYKDKEGEVLACNL